MLAASAGAAGIAAGVRPDGALLAVAPATALVMLRRLGTSWRGITAGGAALLAGLAAGAAPWAVRNLVTWGMLDPPGASAALWLTDYDQLFAYRDTPSFTRWLDAGLASAALARAGALAANLAVAGQPLLYYLAPAALLGAMRLRSLRAAYPAVAYAIALWLVLSLCFPFQSARGSFFHSLTCLLPYLAIAVVVGVEALVVMWGTRRKWRLAEAQRVFASALVGLAAVASIYFAVQFTQRWDGRLAAYRAVAGWLDAAEAPPGRVMAIDPPAFWYASGRESVVIPSDGFGALVAAAHDLDVTFLLVERAAPRYLLPVFDGEEALLDFDQVATVAGIRIYQFRPSADVALT
jgi:hypothetical protein